MLKKFAYKAVAASLLVSLSGMASAALSDQWYIGIGGGISQLQPEATDASIDVDDKNGQVGTIYVGKDFDSRSSGQFQLYSLGESSFDDGQSTASYIGGDASLLYRFFDSRDRRARGAVFGASFYGRFGFGFLDRDSDLPLDNDAPVYFGAGAGVETYFTNNLGLRLEALYHETDTASATLSLITRFGGHRSRSPARPPAIATPIPVPVPTPEATAAPEPASVATTSPVNKPTALPLPSNVPDQIPETPAAPAPAVVPLPAPATDLDTATLPEQGPGSAESPLNLPTLDTLDQTSNPESVAVAPDTDFGFPDVEIMGSTQETTAQTDPAALEPFPAVTPLPEPSAAPVPLVDSDGDGVTDDKDRCPDSTRNYPVSTRGCPLFAGLLPDLTFQDDSAEFDETSYVVLDKLAKTLMDYPDTFIEVVAHTDNSGPEAEQSALTRQRLRSVGLYLVNRGISQDRLLLRSFGGKRPAFDNATADGRRRNNRIEIFENP